MPLFYETTHSNPDTEGRVDLDALFSGWKYSRRSTPKNEEDR